MIVDDSDVERYLPLYLFKMALKGIRVLEFSGLAPGPMCGMILSDFGATVTRIDKISYNPLDVLKAGKRTLSLNLKNPKAIEIVKKLSKNSDVLIEPFRPGVMERLGIGPETLMNENPQLIYARLTGFGQKGIYSERAGHDINYIAVSGVLSMFGRKNEKPTAPINFAADFAGGSLSCAFGICVALLERHRSGKGQIIDSAMVDGSAYVASWLFRSRSLPIWNGKRGENLIDTGHHSYDTYETKDGKFMSVGALEPQFYAELLDKLEVDSDEISQFSDSENNREKLAKIFKTKTEKEWSKIFDSCDACTFPVLEWDQAHLHPHNQANKTFEVVDDVIVPQPAPKLSRTPGRSGVFSDEHKKDSITMAKEILDEIGISMDEMKQLHHDQILILNEGAKL